ncbi:hypothetical protein [Tunturiibacter gelidiferens]|uniref:hypothetical protein n=1 Tax=Tunturiibacter gelidiferens TaxID=3069689 RepID=UPI003D9BAA5C
MLFNNEKSREIYADEVSDSRFEYFIRRIKDLVASREFIIESSEMREVKLPLFWLSCPIAERSEVHYKEEIIAGTLAGLQVEVFGTGMGANQTALMTCASEFQVAAGEYKLVFITFPLRVYLVSVYEKGLPVGRGLRSEVPDERKREFRLGIETETTQGSLAALKKRML